MSPAANVQIHLPLEQTQHILFLINFSISLFSKFLRGSSLLILLNLFFCFMHNG